MEYALSRLVKNGMIGLTLLWGVNASAYIPPIPQLLKGTMENRKSHKAVEMGVNYRVQLSSGGAVNVDETMVWERGKVTCVWSMSGVGKILAYRKKDHYEVRGLGKLYSRSRGFLTYFVSTTVAPLLKQLRNEGFIASEQLRQFDKEYEPEGDPKGWQTSEKFLRHPGIFLSRLTGNHPVIAVQGTRDSSQKKTVYFEKAGFGLAGFRWEDGSLATSWEFSEFQAFPVGGMYPKRLKLVINNQIRVKGQVNRLRPMKKKKLSEFKRNLAAIGEPSSNSSVKRVLETLMSYR